MSMLSMIDCSPSIGFSREERIGRLRKRYLNSKVMGFLTGHELTRRPVIIAARVLHERDPQTGCESADPVSYCV
jgi:hypothetical protein